MKMLVLSTMFMASSLLAQMSSYKAPEKLYADGALITHSEGAISPTLVDYDDDGDLDLFLGTFDVPRLFYYENTGSKTSPNFTSHGEVKQSNGSPITAGNF